MSTPRVAGFPASYDAYMNVSVAWCDACALETSGWCGGCETCLMIASPKPHNCAPIAAAQPLERSTPDGEGHTPVRTL